MNRGLPIFWHHAIHGEKQHTSVTDRLVLVLPLKRECEKMWPFMLNLHEEENGIFKNLKKQMSQNLHQSNNCHQRIVLET